MTSGTEAGPSPAAQLVLRSARPAHQRPGPGRGDRIWRVTADGVVEAVVGRRPATGPAPEPLLVGRVVGRGPGHPRRARAELMPAPPTRSRPRGRTAVAGLGVALVTVGLVAAVVSGGAPPVPAPAAGSAAAGIPPDVLQVLPALPAGEFVYPILPAAPGVPVLPTGLSPGLVYPGPGPAGLLPALPVLPPVPAPSLAVPTIPTSVVPGPLREGEIDRPGGVAGPKPGTGAAPTRGPSTPTPPPPPPPRPCAPAPVTPLADMPVKVQLLDFEPESLLRAEQTEGGLPDVDCGGGLGLWSGSTAETSVLVLGAKHLAVAELTPGQSAGRSITVRHGDGSAATIYQLGETRVIRRDAAVELLEPIDASPPIVIFVTIGDDAVTVVEAR